MSLRGSLIADRVDALGVSPAVSAAPTETIGQVIARMVAERVGCIVVVHGDRLEGIFTERDVLTRVLAAGAKLDQPIQTVMTPKPDVLHSDATVADVVRRMHDGGYRHMPVVARDGILAGVVSVKRVAEYLVEHFPATIYNLPPDPTQRLDAPEGA